MTNSRQKRAGKITRWVRRNADAPAPVMGVAGLALGGGLSALLFLGGPTVTLVGAALLGVVGIAAGATPALGTLRLWWIERRRVIGEGKGPETKVITQVSTSLKGEIQLDKQPSTAPESTIDTPPKPQSEPEVIAQVSTSLKGETFLDTQLSTTHKPDIIDPVVSVTHNPTPTLAPEPADGDWDTTPTRRVVAQPERADSTPQTERIQRLERELVPWLKELSQSQWTPALKTDTFPDLRIWENHVVDTIDQSDKRKLLKFQAPPGIDMVLIPGGEFWMGASEGDSSADSDEKPRHRVRVSTFSMATVPITQAQWKQWKGVAKNSPGFPGADRPIENITWFEAVQFCNTLSEQSGLATVYQIDGKNVTLNPNANGYRLPTEAEWEYAVRAGTQTKYFFGDGDNDLEQYAWFTKNAESQTHPVAEKHPNPWGLYDMYGNVWEWCWDWKANYPNDNDTHNDKSPNKTDKNDKDQSFVENPRGPEEGASRVIRGGSFWSETRFLRSSFRSSWYPDSWRGNQGFRVVRSSFSQHGR